MFLREDVKRFKQQFQSTSQFLMNDYNVVESVNMKVCAISVAVRERVEKLEMLVAERNCTELPSVELATSSPPLNHLSAEHIPTNHAHPLLNSTPFRNKMKNCEWTGKRLCICQMLVRGVTCQ